MSTRIERRLKRCRNEETPSKILKSASDSEKKLNSTSEKKTRRKRIRCTHDFNQLSSSSLTSLDSDESTKPKVKKTKKTKILYSLPKISHIAEDLSVKPEQITYDGNCFEFMPKVRRKKSRKQSAKKNGDLETERHSKKQFGFEQNGDDGDDDEEKENTDFISDSNRDSEVEIFIKNKRLKKSNSSNIDTKTPVQEVQTNTMQTYAKRIRKLLSDTSIRKSNSSNTSSSHVSTPVSGKKSKENILNKKFKAKQVEYPRTPKADIKIETSSTGRNDKQNTTSKKSVSVRVSHQDTPHPNVKLRFSSYDASIQEQPRKLRSGSKKSLSENFSPSIKKKQISSTLTENISFDMDFESDDVFFDTFEKQVDELKNSTFCEQETVSNNILPNNVTIKTRKSVRFQSPQENIRRETVVLSNLMTHNASCNVAIPQTSEVRASTSGSTRRNSIFEVISPKALNQSLHSTINTSRKSLNESPKRKSSEKLFSPENKSLKKSINERDVSFNKSINNLITSISPTMQIEANISGLKELNTTDQSIPQIINPRLLENDVNNSPVTNVTISANTPRLIRTATFTKDEPAKQSLDVSQNLEYDSPVHTSFSKPIDTSKVNKRRRWDKSRLSVSFLENSVDIENISMPWLKDEINISLNNTGVDIPKQSLEGKCSPTINNTITKKTLAKNDRTPPSASSTPFPKGKANLLRQALLNDKKDITAIENIKRKEEPPPHKFVRSKIPNFALIHQRAMDRMENIKDMSERKAARAKLLLSGHKPPIKPICEASSRRKELTYSPAHSKSIRLKENESIDTTRSQTKANVSVTKIAKVSPSKSNPKILNRTTPIEKKKQLLKSKSVVPKSKLPNAVVAEKKGFTRFGFKLKAEGAKAATKDEQVKAVAMKTKITKNSVDERRTIIQGVRSNRRFELLMQKRNK